MSWCGRVVRVFVGIVAAAGCALTPPAASAASDPAAPGIVAPSAGVDPPAAHSGSIPPDTLPPPRRPGDRTAHLARLVPGGFGGFWLQGGEVHAFLTDLSKRARAQAVLEEQLRGEMGPGAGGALERVSLDRIVFHRARYDYLQLEGWYLRLIDRLDHRDVEFTGIAERENRITVGVRTPAAAEQARRRAAELGIPRDAVTTELVRESWE